MILDFSDRDLTEIAGWKAWKAGNNHAQLFENLKIKDSAISGFLKQGRKKTHTSVKYSGSEYTPLCTCSDFYQSHGFCSHSVALLLQAREVKNIPVEKPYKKIENKNTPSEQWILKGTLLKDLNTIGKNISLRVSLLKGDDQNNALFPFIHALGLPLKEGEHLIQLTVEQLPELLQLNANTSFLYLADGSFSGSTSACRFPLEATREKTTLSLSAPQLSEWNIKNLNQDILLLNNSSYNLQPCPNQQVKELLLNLISGTQTYSIEQILKNYDLLSQWFDLQEVSTLIQPLLVAESPIFKLSLNGTVKKVQASISVLYGDEEFPLTEPSSGKTAKILGYTSDLDTFKIRNASSEREALHLIEEASFTLNSGEFLLEGEHDIQEFIAYTLPQLTERNWKVSMMGSFRAFAHNATVLSLTLKLDAHSDGFVSFSYTFQTPEGQGMKATDAQRLMQSGKQSFKLNNGRVALLSRKQYQLISEALLDSSVKQIGEKFSTSSRNLNYLLNLSINKINNPSKEEVIYKIPQKERLSFFSLLRPYQREGVAWLIQTLQTDKAALLADDMGLGKTVQTIATAEYLSAKEQGRILIICPASLISNWHAEIKRWLPDTSIEFAVTSYQKYLSNAKAHQEEHYLFCILDEASMIKNSDSKVSQAVRLQPATYKLALTGTPLENSVNDLWSIFQFLMPTYLGNQKHFKERFVKPLEKTGYTAQLASKRLRAKLDSYTLRRTKAKVLTDLPPKTHRIDYCEMNSVQKRAGEKIRRDYQLLKEGSEGTKNAIQILTSVLRLRQTANDPALTNPEVSEISPKTKRLIQILEQAKQTNQKVLIFSQFAQMLNILESQLTERGFSSSVLTGATRDRDEQISKFKDPTGNQLFLISLKAGGYGLNLTEASIVIHYDPWWNPAVENQATDRAYRIGQTEPVSVIKLISEHSIDERILKLQESKQNLHSLAIDDHKPNLTGLSTQELESLLT